MSPQELERTAHTVECFLNALGLEDGRPRTLLEAQLVQWLTAEGHSDAHLIYHQQEIRCHRGRLLGQTLPVPQVTLVDSLWCDRKKLSRFDSEAYARDGKLILLGTAGLALTLPGTAATMTTTRSSSWEISSSNNNNNNNNNNG